MASVGELWWFQLIGRVFVLTLYWKAFHDMATHNIEDGTGGLDGSIQFEFDRPAVGLVLLPESLLNANIYSVRMSG